MELTQKQLKQLHKLLIDYGRSLEKPPDINDMEPGLAEVVFLIAQQIKRRIE